MEKQKMTIHRALAELKLIDSKIEKAISVIDPTGVKQEGKLVNSLTDEELFKSEAKSKFQSVNDLIIRKTLIKSAIVEANGVTSVSVGGVEMTIADAINFKTTIEFKKDLITSLKQKHNKVKAIFIKKNEELDNVALENAKIMIGKQGDNNIKATDEDVKAIVEPYVKRNKLHLIDPLDVDKLIEKLQNEVDAFEIDVDATLSEINAITIIEI